MVQEAIEKADVLIEAVGWIRQFRDKITVIKLGGSVMEDPTALDHLLVDVVFMETVGMRPIVVHGGGAAISRAMAEAGIEPSVGSVGDSYDNTLAESIIGLYKTEVIWRNGPWRNMEEVEFATLEWVD